MTDTLYYSNYCPHCNKLLEFMNKNGLLEKETLLASDIEILFKDQKINK